MAFGNGQASAEGLGPGITDAIKSFKDKGNKPAKPTKLTPAKLTPAKLTPAKPAGQFADAPYGMGAPGAVPSQEPGGGMDA
jgi:hypothetical protein